MWDPELEWLSYRIDPRPVPSATQKDVAVCEDSRSTAILNLEFLAFRTMRHKLLLFIKYLL